MAMTAKKNTARDANAPVLVSGVALALHFGVAKQRVDQLALQGVIERRPDGKFDQDICRRKYLDHLRSEHRKSPRSEADAEYQRVKAEALRLKIAERTKQLVPADWLVEFIDEMAGIVLTGLSSLPARSAGRDIAVRRAIEREVFAIRKEISETATAMAERCGTEATPS